jgi:hypothetical protein
MKSKQHEQESITTTRFIVGGGAVATAVVASMVVAVVGIAAAVPTRPDGEVGSGYASQDGSFVEKPCHITPHEWNQPADGAPWVCYRYVP